MDLKKRRKDVISKNSFFLRLISKKYFAKIFFTKKNQMSEKNHKWI